MEAKTIKWIIGINAVLLIVLIILLIFAMQKYGGKEQSIEELAAKALLEKKIGDVYAEAKDKPYFESHPEELQATQLKFNNLAFTKGVEAGKPIPNAANEFRTGETIGLSFEIVGYANPKVKDNYYLYGVSVSSDTKDSEGNIVKPLSQQIADAVNHRTEKNMPLIFNVGILPDESVKKGNYTIKLKAKDKISGLEAEIEGKFKII